MDELSDNEREEWLRRTIRENWMWVVGGIGIGLAALGGWQYWQRAGIERADSAHTNYTQGIEALGRNDSARAAVLLTELRGSGGESPYADQLELALARAAMDKRDFDGAAVHLNAVIAHAGDGELVRIARTRLARVLLEQGKHDEALALLDAAQAGAFAPLYLDIRGDAYAAKGDAAAAVREYDAALAADPESLRIDRAYVELKRNALPGAILAAAPAAAAVEPSP